MADSSRAATVCKAAMVLVQQPMAPLPRHPAMARKARQQACHSVETCHGFAADEVVARALLRPTCYQGRSLA